MSEVRFQNNEQSFQELVKLAQEKAKDGKITSAEKQELISKALEDNEITADERKFLKALESNGNVKALKDGSSDANFTLDFSLEVADKPKKYAEGSFNEDTGMMVATPQTPVEGGSTEDIGETRLKKRFEDQQITSEDLESELLNNPKVKNSPELQKSLLTFTAKLGLDDKEAMVYLKELIVEREPVLSEADLKAVLAKLSAMLETKYDKRAGDNRNLVVSALHDIAAPTNIAQNDLGSCAGTSVQIQLALTNPQEYLKMLDSLAQNKSFKTISGKQIPPNWSFANEGNGRHDSGRMISSKIMQNAIMDFADGSRRSYDSSSNDKSRRDGLNSEEEAKVISAISGKEIRAYRSNDYTQDQLMDILKNENPSQEKPIQIDLFFASELGHRDAFHSVNVIGIKDGNVTIINPWGQKETFSIEELQKRITSVSAEKGKDTALGIEKYNGALTKKELPDLLAKIKDENQSELFLNSLTAKQKAQLIKLLSPPDNEEKKSAIMNILNNAMRSGKAQDHQAIGEIWNTLASSNISILDILKKIKSEDPKFIELGKQLNHSLIGNENLKVEVAKIVLGNKDVENSPHLSEFLATMNKQGLAIAIKELNIQANKITDPDLAKKLLKSAFETYTDTDSGVRSPLTKEQINKFMNDLAKDRPELAKAALNEFIDNNQFKTTKLAKGLGLADNELIKKDPELSKKILKNFLEDMAFEDLNPREVKQIIAKLDPDNTLTKSILSDYSADEISNVMTMTEKLGWKFDKISDSPDLAGKYLYQMFYDATSPLKTTKKGKITEEIGKDLEIIKNLPNKKEIAAELLKILNKSGSGEFSQYNRVKDDPKLKALLEEFEKIAQAE